MRLYVIDKKTKNKIYLDIDSTTRSELSVRIPKRRFNVEGMDYSIDEIKAEKSTNKTALSMAIGGVVGLVGGTVGVVAGGVLGGIVGRIQDIKETAAVNAFNGKRK